jgi:uncharacterized protein YgiM (DUF1202 family)
MIGCNLRLIVWPKSIVRLAAAAAIIVTGASASAITVQHRALSARAIVTADEAGLRVSPFDHAKSLTSLAPGRVLYLLGEESHDDYLLARLESGQKGWIKRSEFEQPTITRK